ncbi:MAG: hypothetical protein U0324_45835 [Polyangiales bacterium]
MRALTKGREPASLRAYRAVPGAAYDGADFTAVKDEIREALLRDQAWLCCYCMRRISAEARPHPVNREAPPVIQMKVEHWRPQSLHPDLALAWSNLLGACTGGVGVAPADQTCDTRKAESVITLNPCDPAHVATLRCSTRGHLTSSNPQFQEDLDVRLGLNHRVLVDARRAVIQRALARLNASLGAQEWSLGAMRAALDDAESSQGGRAPELCGTLRLWARGRFGGAV